MVSSCDYHELIDKICHISGVQGYIMADDLTVVVMDYKTLVRRRAARMYIV